MAALTLRAIQKVIGRTAREAAREYFEGFYGPFEEYTAESAVYVELDGYAGDQIIMRYSGNSCTEARSLYEAAFRTAFKKNQQKAIDKRMKEHGFKPSDYWQYRSKDGLIGIQVDESSKGLVFEVFVEDDDRADRQWCPSFSDAFKEAEKLAEMVALVQKFENSSVYLDRRWGWGSKSAHFFVGNYGETGVEVDLDHNGDMYFTVTRNGNSEDYKDADEAIKAALAEEEDEET